MARNVCPTCKEVVLSFDSDSSIRCSKCETEFEVINDDLGDVINNNLGIESNEK